MTRAFFYLAACSMRNRLHVRLRRLREPRYFAGLVIGASYVGFVITRPDPAGYAGGPWPRPDEASVALGVLGAMGLLAMAALAWVLPSTGRPALTFSRADIQFLFTAPVSRRQLLHYKIIRSQAGALVGSALVTIVLRPATFAQGWTFFLGMLLVMATVNLHLTGVSLWRESLRAHGRPSRAGQWLPVAAVVGAVLVVAASAAIAWPAIIDLSSRDGLVVGLRHLATTWPVRVVLWPFTSMMRVPLSGSAPEFLAALPVGLAVLAVNYLWVVRSDVAFEEAAARDAEQQVLRRRRYVPNRAERRPAPFRLRPGGRPEVALLWKNLILASRLARWSVFWRLVPILVVVAFAVSQAARTLADALMAMCALGAAGVAFVGPQILRNDLRQDLAQIATLKQWPVSGAAIVRGEVLAPAVLLSAMVWLLLMAAVVLSGQVTFDVSHNPVERLSWAVAAMLVAPGVIVVEIVVQNALAILFPAWVDLGATSARGMEVMGQRVLAAGGLIVALGLALVPAGLVAAAVTGAIHAFTSVPAMVAAAAAASGTLLVESALVCAALGRVVDRMDASAVVPIE